MLATLLVRDRALAVGGLVVLTLLAWIWLLRAGQGRVAPGSLEQLLALVAMWAVMMIAMMAPVAAPAVVTYLELCRRRRSDRDPVFHAGALAAGFLSAWIVYSLAGAILQWGFTRLAWADRLTAGSAWGGVVFVLAGLYQWAPVKHACLRHCRSPLGMLITGWRPGARGALRMGVEQGGHCVACCWALMALMLVVGAMSPLWLAALAAFCLAERLLPAGHALGRFAGAGLLGWGVLVIVT